MDDPQAPEVHDQAADLRARAEAARQRPPAPASGPPPRASDPAAVLHELEVHQLELEAQNEELRRSQAALDALRAKYFDLYDLAPVGYLTLDATGLIDQANLTATRLLGVDRRALPGRSLVRFLVAEDQQAYSLCRTRLLATKTPQHCEVRLASPAGTAPAWVQLDLNLDRAGADTGSGCRVTLTDIADRKRAEAALQADIGQRQRTEGALRTSLAERDAAVALNATLFREVHHRVKNNLQMLCSLLELQADAIESPEGKAALELSTTRIYTIARLYEQLYRSMTGGQVLLGEYLRGLAENLQQTYGRPGIAFRLPALTALALDVDRAIPCGLILNELVTNAVKHAFPGTATGEVGVDVQPVGDRIQFRVWDNGRGRPNGLDIEHSKSLGLRLVRILAQRLRADIKVESYEGTAFTLTFPLHADPPLEPKPDEA